MGNILKDLAMDLGIKKGHRDYTRFIILGRSRTGSNFLRGLLNSHPGILVFGEILKNDQSVEWGLEGYPATGRPLKLLREDGARFMEDAVFKKHPPAIQAVGFKLFYYHAQENLARPIWDYLHSHTEIRVIHIKRRNMLRTHLSRRRAELTDRWYNLNGEREQEEAVTLDFEQCRQDFEQTRRWDTDYDAFFAGHPKLEVLYEPLSEDPEAEMGRIQAFLGVECRSLRPETYRQSNLPLAQAIANFAELKTRFQGTPWEAFFEEE
jgi:LPS sulfotransferase NodH